MHFFRNQKSRQECFKELYEEDFRRVIVAFDRRCSVKNINTFRNEVYIMFRAFKAVGKIYIATDGINGLISIPYSDLDRLIVLMKTPTLLFQSNFHVSEVTSVYNFYRLQVKIKPKTIVRRYHL